ncbi:MAG: hypothetical protein QM681_25285, partial [Novosphingobium sp.]
MIQSTAPSLTAALSSASGAPAALAAGGDFAALLGTAPLVAVPVEGAALPMVETLPVAEQETAAPLSEAVKDAQDGLAALVRQAGAASQAPAISLPVMPGNPMISAAPGTRSSATSPIALTAHLPVLAQPAEPSAPAAAAVPMPVPAKAGEPALKATPTLAKAAITADAPMAKADAEALPVVRSDGKSGKPTGKLLPPAIEARPAKAKDETAASDASQANAAPVGQPGDGGVAAKVSVDLPIPTPITGAALPLPEASAPSPAAAPPQDAATPVAPRPAAATVIPAEIRAIRFEPIEIVRAPARPIPAAAGSAVGPVAEALPVADAVLSVTPDRTALPIVPQGDAEPSASSARPIVNAPTASIVTPPKSVLPDPVVTAPAVETDHPAAPSLASQPQVAARDPLARQAIEGPQDGAAVPLPANASPAAPIAAPTAPPIATSTARTEHAGAAPSAIAPEDLGETETRTPAEADKPAAHVVETAVRPATGQPLTADLGPVAQDATFAPTLSVAAEAPHDFDTLVSRLAEAREAAAPHVVRTAFEHAEFGRVAMQLGQDENGLSVTLSSRDADFAPSVQAAAAAVASSAAGGNADQQRHDAPTSQQQNPNGQSQQARAETSPQNGGQNTGKV